MAAFLAVSIRLSIGLAIASSIETSLEVTLNTLSIPYLISEALSFSTLPAITKILQLYLFEKLITPIGAFPLSL